jgi:restriction endonuclease S subunit
MREIPIPIPPMEDQHRLASNLKAWSARIDLDRGLRESRFVALMELKNRMLASTLDAAA